MTWNTDDLNGWLKTQDWKPIELYEVNGRVVFPLFGNFGVMSRFLIYLIGPLLDETHASVFAIRLSHLMDLEHQKMKVLKSLSLFKTQILQKKTRSVDMNGGELGSGYEEDKLLENFFTEL